MSLVKPPLHAGDVVQVSPDAAGVGALGGLLAIIIGVAPDDTYTCESVQAGRVATLDRVPGAILTLIGRAAFSRVDGRWLRVVGPS